MTKTQVKINSFLFSLLNSSASSSKISQLVTEFDESTEDFLKALIVKIHGDTGIKKGVFQYTHKYFELLINQDNNFEKFAEEISSSIHFLMVNNTIIPSGDGIFVNATVEGIDYFYFFKLNYQKRFTHVINDDLSLELVESQVILPSASQKCDEGFFINLFDKELFIKDKKYTIETEPVDYLSNYILGLVPSKSEDEIMQIINEVTTNIIEKHYDTSSKKIMDYKNTLAETAEATSTINTHNINENIFSDNKEAEQEYMELLANNGITDREIPISKKLEKKLTKKQKMMTSNGIELLVPIEHLAQPDLFEYREEPNGKLTILIKDVDKIENN